MKAALVSVPIPPSGGIKVILKKKSPAFHGEGVIRNFLKNFIYLYLTYLFCIL